jgi:hypothetical protein
LPVTSTPTRPSAERTIRTSARLGCSSRHPTHVR